MKINKIRLKTQLVSKLFFFNKILKKTKKSLNRYKTLFFTSKYESKSPSKSTLNLMNLTYMF